MNSRWLAPSFVAIILGGALLRVVRLHLAPPGLFFDEAANLFDIANVLKGARPLYFPANNGREPFFFYWASLFASLLGDTPYALRLAGAMMGTLTLPAVFFCGREMARCWDRDRKWSDAVGLTGMFVLAITYFHLHYSRYGLRTISLPFFLALSFGLLFRSLRRDSLAAAAGAGIFGGLSIYTYLSSRLAPFVLIVPLAFAAFGPRAKRDVPRIVLIGLLWVLVSVPLGVYYLRHPDAVQGHTDDVSILNPANNHGDPVGAVVHGVVATLGAIDVEGSRLSDQNLAGRPIFDPLLSIFFGVGLIAIAASFVPRAGAAISQTGRGSPGLAPTDRPFAPPGEDKGEGAANLRPQVAVFLLVWILDQSAPSMFSVSPPGFVRLTGILPAIAIVAGLGICTLDRWCRRHRVRPGLVLVGLTAALAVSTAWTIRDYFFVWAPSDDAYNWMMAPKADAGSFLHAVAATDRVFLAPLWAEDYTVKYSIGGAPVQSFDLGQTLVVPTDRARNVDYFFPATDAAEAAQVAASLPIRPTQSTINDPSGQHPILIRLALRASELPVAPPVVATFEDGIGLIGARFDPPRATSGGTVQLTLQWIDQRPSTDDYTVFIHVRDAANATVAQTDGRPGAGSFPTNVWRPGDLVWDRHQLMLASTIRPGTYRVVVGMYRLADQKRLAAHLGDARAPNDEVPIGTLEVSPP